MALIHESNFNKLFPDLTHTKNPSPCIPPYYRSSFNTIGRVRDKTIQNRLTDIVNSYLSEFYKAFIHWYGHTDGEDVMMHRQALTFTPHTVPYFSGRLSQSKRLRHFPERDFFEYLVEKDIVDHVADNVHIPMKFGSLHGEYILNKFQSCMYNISEVSEYDGNQFVKDIQSVIQTHWPFENKIVECSLGEIRKLFDICDEILMENIGKERLAEMLRIFSIPVEKWLSVKPAFRHFPYRTGTLISDEAAMKREMLKNTVWIRAHNEEGEWSGDAKKPLIHMDYISTKIDHPIISLKIKGTKYIGEGTYNWNVGVLENISINRNAWLRAKKKARKQCKPVIAVSIPRILGQSNVEFVVFRVPGVWNMLRGVRTDRMMKGKKLPKPVTHWICPIPPDFKLALGSGLGNAYGGNLKEAIAFFNVALKKDLKTPIPFVERGKCFVLQKDHECAFDDFQSALNMDIDNDQALFWRGFLYSKALAFENACVDFTRLVEIDPLFDIAWFARAVAMIAMGNFPAALEDLNTLNRLRPYYVLTHYLRGYLNCQLRQGDEGANDMNRFIRCVTDEKMNLPSKDGDFETTIQLYRTAREYARKKHASAFEILYKAIQSDRSWFLKQLQGDFYMDSVEMDRRLIGFLALLYRRQ